MLKISVVLPIFNGLAYTKGCLASLKKQIEKVYPKNASFSVIICDDASTDGSSEWISANHPDIVLLKGNGQLWWSGGINCCVEYALDKNKVDYIIWWNNDILSKDNYFLKVVEVIREHGPSVVVGSKVYLAQYENKIWSMGGFFDPETGTKDMYGRGKEDGEEYQRIQECEWLPGMGTIVHKSVYQKIGMVDAKSFPQYHGDSDFTYRAKLAGFNVLVDPRLIIYNDTSNSGIFHDESFRRFWQSLFSIKSNYNIKKNFLFYKKYGRSIKSYKGLIIHYSLYIGGFFKWKLLGVFGMKRRPR
jgi:GT2 family glycosyltransferase